MTAPFDLRAAAHRAMLANGFLPDVPADVQAEVRRASDLAGPVPANVRDMRPLPWSSIDNDSSKDLDQLEVADRLSDSEVRVRVAIADVDGTVVRGSATDHYAGANATSVYTGVATFPMLPDRLSTQLTSLAQESDRPAVVIEFVVTASGDTRSHDVYLARVENRAKLAYGSVGAWLDGKGAAPPAATIAIQDQLRLQDLVAQSLRANRARRGALSLETIEAQSVVRADQSVSIELVEKTRASHLIEDFMIAANVVMAQFLDAHGSPSIRRVVRTPERWDRIIALAATTGDELPDVPSSAALEEFLAKRRAADPERFADLSLSVVKLIGPGEYALHAPGSADAGHFGLATHDYTHSTAPNRRFADLVTQRLLKAVLEGGPAPYSADELAQIAQHCTEREDAARKVERQVRKEAAAVSMAPHVGESFDAIVTGVTPKGTFVRIVAPPVEGRVMRGERGLDVGDRVRVSLLSTDAAHGFVDFGVKE
jgi:exoribonuclease-2